MINRMEAIKKKGFAMGPANEDAIDYTKPVTDFSKIRVGVKTLEDALVENIGAFKKVNSHLADKETVLRAINDLDYNLMREISDFFFKTSGIYARLVRYMAYLYRYDWMVTPYINTDREKINTDKVLETFYKALNYLDNFNVKEFCGEAALKVIKDGCYYGYTIPQADRLLVQDLPANYCRSRYSVNGRPAVEFNMKFFDDYYKDTNQRIRIIKLFPDEFAKGYKLYKEGKLIPDFAGDKSGWYLLDPDRTVKFSLNNMDYPAFIAVIPAIIDLNSAQELDRKKMAQRLLKIIVQKMPIDKNGDLVFDVDEAQQLHNNALGMLGKAIGIDVLTTFADVDVADMADRNTTTTVDDLSKVERGVFNEAGVSQMQFNTDGNIALEKSILNDEATMYNLICQFETFLNDVIRRFNKTPKKINYRVQMLSTTIYNYKDLSKMYKEQMQLGYSKMLAQIALGQTQSAILATAYFENDILDLASSFIPPMMSSTMNSDVLKRLNDSNQDKAVGRPDNESQGKDVTEKTIQNKESGINDKESK